MPVTDADVAADLDQAGVVFLERIHEEVRLPLPPPPPFHSPATCGPEHGRFDSTPEEIVDVSDPEMATKVNAGWWRMATEYGVIDDHREFLLSVDYRAPGEIDPEYAWIRVRLSDEWDLAGSGSTALRSGFAGLFTDRFVPEFSMLSLDCQAMLSTTVWGLGTVSTIVIRPDRLINRAR